MATESQPPTLVFPGIPPNLVGDLQNEWRTCKHRPFGDITHVEILRHEEGLVFRLQEGKAGYSFCRRVGGANDVETFRDFLHNPVQTLYMPITYEVKQPGDEVVQGILDRYAVYGSQHAAKIDWIWFERDDRHLLILRIPKEIVAAMMKRHGGALSTQVRGPVSAIRRLPVLSKIVPEDALDGETMHRAFVTPYTNAEQYEQCMAIHNAAVREVMDAGACGISIGPIGVWSP